MAARFYPANDARQTRQSRLIYSADDLRRAIGIAAATGATLNCELAADLYLDSTVTIPADLSGFRLDGAGYQVVLGANLSPIFDALCTASFRGLQVDTNGYTLGAAYTSPVTTLTLAGANPTVAIGVADYVQLAFDASCSGNAVLSQGSSGQRVTLECTAYAGSATLPDSSASLVKLSAAWTPTADDTLSLIWNGNYWLEVSRSVN